MSKPVNWDSPDLTPKQVEFREALRRLRPATELMLRDQVARLPAGIATRLERGPLPSRYACGVCDAFGRDFIQGTVDLSDPRWWVWAYHEVPKLDARFNDDQHYGPIANRIYERTIATYRAAGWTGEATPANA